MEEETTAREPTNVNRGVVKEETVRVETTYVTDNLGRLIVCGARGEARCARVDDEGGDRNFGACQGTSFPLLAHGDSFGHLFSSAPLSSSPSVSYSFSPLTSSTSMSSILWFSTVRNESGVVVCVSKNTNNQPFTGAVFEPFEEVNKELDLVLTHPQVSLVRQKFTDESEATINEHINVEYNVLYIYHAMFAYFDRDNVARKGFSRNRVRKKGSCREINGIPE
ncbi:hypothetical protein C1H46_018488 [Malus baccata]|uniref:Uncharacterized protein n=1 Tax=Malus baccata TaxID=106549 RepID=A0A540MAZ6_MALBA|nr:hypothetical protein C1H46_018488 [Malus baccata]